MGEVHKSACKRSNGAKVNVLDKLNGSRTCLPNGQERHGGFEDPLLHGIKLLGLRKSKT